MNAAPSVRGVWCATLTPLDVDGSPDTQRLATHVRRIFAAGVDGIALFGTTGEGQSFTVGERRAGLDGLLAAGIAAGRILVGTGCVALPDTIELTRHAVRAGCIGALMLPPFFFKNVGDEGIYASFARVIDAVADAHLKVYLYHLPQLSGVAISADVVDRLVAAYPETIAGIKDSECNLDHTRRLLARFRDLAILVGCEPHLPAALAAGGAGTICGMANLFPRLIRRLHDLALTQNHIDDLVRVERFIAELDRYPLFAAFKALQSSLYADEGWEALRPPLARLEPAARRAWLDGVATTGIVAERDAA